MPPKTFQNNSPVLRTLCLLSILVFIRISAFAQDPIVASFTRACAPFPIELDSTNLDGGAYVIVYEPGDTTTSLSHTFVNPGNYDIQIFSQSGAYVIPISVETASPPTFTTFTCSGHQLRVQLDAPIYDEYELVFQPGDTLRGSASIPEYTFTYAGAGTRTVRVTGNYSGGFPNCPTAEETVVTRDALLPSQLAEMRPTSTTEISLSAVLAANTDHRLEQTNQGASFFQRVQSPSRTTNLNTSLTNTSGNFQCARVVGFDICNGDEVFSDTACTAILQVNAQFGFNEINWVTEPLPNRSYTLMKNGSPFGNFSQATQTGLRDEDVECNVEYSYQLRIDHPTGAVSYSLPVSVIGNGLGTPPELVQPFVSVVNGVTVGWMPPIGQGADMFFIQREDALIDSVGPSSLGYVDSEADPNTGPVCYQMYYRDICGNESLQTDSLCTIFLSHAGTTSTSVELKWTPYIGEPVTQGYIVEVLDDDGQRIDFSDVGNAFTFNYDLGVDPPSRLQFRVSTALDSNRVSYSNIALVRLQSTLGIPNAFTPDGDGLNDTFIFKGNFIASSHMSIYNRWGELVYNQEDAHLGEGWNGTFGNAPAMEGVYTYFIQTTNTEGEVIERRGRVILVRRP